MKNEQTINNNTFDNNSGKNIHDKNNINNINKEIIVEKK